MRGKILFFIVTLSLTSCFDTKREIRVEVDSINQVTTKDEVKAKIIQTFKKSNKLTEEQKKGFLELHSKVMKEVKTIDQNMGKLKLVLIKHLAEQNYDSIKVNELRRQLKKLHNKKFDVMINSMSKAREILGVEFEKFHPKHGYYIL